MTEHCGIHVQLTPRIGMVGILTDLAVRKPVRHGTRGYCTILVLLDCVVDLPAYPGVWALCARE